MELYTAHELALKQNTTVIPVRANKPTLLSGVDTQLVQKTVSPGWNANPIHYCAHSSQTNLIDYFHNSSTDATYLLLGLPSGPLPVAFPTRIYVQFSLTTYGLHA